MSAPPRVVVLTPPGRGAVASLRIEGDQAAEVVAKCFTPVGGTNPSQAALGKIVFGRFGDEEVVFCRRKADAVEVHCHGGRYAIENIVDALLELGAVRQEGTDWIEAHAADAIAAEAHVALTQARTWRTAGILLAQFDGALTGALLEIEVVIETGDAPAALERIDDLLRRAEVGVHLVEPWRVVLAGRPNVGKSSLINALVGYQRALVFDQPGTTRDVVTTLAAMQGWSVELADTAGLRSSSDPLEAAGVERARRQLDAADLVVLVFDGAQPWSDEDAQLADQFPEAVLVHNKCDLPSPPGQRPSGLTASAVTGEGIESLVRRIAQRLVPDIPPDGAAVPFTSRQVAALSAARQALDDGDAPTALHRLHRLRQH